MTLKNEAKRMFEKYHLLEEHLEKQNDSEGSKLMLELLESTSALLTILIRYNNEIIKYNNKLLQCLDEVMEVEQNDNKN